jgi:chromosome segregation ATPase
MAAIEQASEQPPGWAEQMQKRIAALEAENEALRDRVDDHDERLEEVEATADTACQEVAEVCEDVDDLEDEADEGRKARAELREKLVECDERVDDLEDEADEGRKARTELREDVDRNRDRSLGSVALVRTHITGAFRGAKTLVEAVKMRQNSIFEAFATEGVDYEDNASVTDALREFAQQGSVLSRFQSSEWEQMESLRTMQMRLKQEMEKKFANQRRAMYAGFEQAGVDHDEALTEYGMDTWSRINKYGIGDVVDHVRETDSRAELLVQNLVEWGKKADDQNGTRVLIRSDTLRDRLRDVRGERIQCVQARRVFEKLTDLCSEDARKVTLTKSKQGKNMLVVEVGTA